MQDPIGDLKSEHGGILQMLRIMEQMASDLNQGKHVERDHLDKVVEFLRNFVDKCHHGKEEGILFPEIGKNRAHVPMIAVLLGEHETGRDLIRGIAEALRAYEPGNAQAYHIAVNIGHYKQLLTEHIQKENVLFAASEQELTESTREDVETRFEALEREVIGEGKHEEYHGWLKELAVSYLSQPQA